MRIERLQLFKACKECLKYDELLHYTNIDVLKIILSARTLKCNSIVNVNDRMEQNRKGIEDLTKGFYVSCFCHCPTEIVSLWSMYGGNKNSEKVLLRFRNFASRLEDVIESDWAWTSENKVIFFDLKNWLTCASKDKAEGCKEIHLISMFDIDYKLPNDETFTKEYEGWANVSFHNSKLKISAPMKDVSEVGHYKTIPWAYEAETRIMCRILDVENAYHEHLLLRLKDEVFRGLKIVANPWASDEFICSIQRVVTDSTLPEDIKDSIKVERSELHGQIMPMQDERY